MAKYAAALEAQSLLRELSDFEHLTTAMEWLHRVVLDIEGRDPERHEEKNTARQLWERSCELSRCWHAKGLAALVGELDEKLASGV